MVPPAPGLFSTTTWVPSAAASLGARMREMVSAVPPGGKVAISRMVPLLGQPGLAWAGAARVAAAAARTVRRLIFMAKAPHMIGLPGGAAMHMPAGHKWRRRDALGSVGIAGAGGRVASLGASLGAALADQPQRPRLFL